VTALILGSHLAPISPATDKQSNDSLSSPERRHSKVATSGTGVMLSLMALMLSSCAETEVPTDVVPINPEASVIATFAISPAAPSVAVGANVQLRALKDSAGLKVPVQVRWLIKDKAIATISLTGVLTGVAVGNTMVGAEATDGGFVTAPVTVTTGGSTPPPPTGTLTSLKPSFMSYLGGSADDMARDVSTDAQGNMYIAGSTNSANFPTTAGAFDRTFNSPVLSSYHDAFITKLSPSGQMIWSTYLGGNGFDRIYALEVDKSGFIYVAGRAGPAFPVTVGSFQPKFAGGDHGGIYGAQDGFVCKFRSDGTRVFCSYFGDSDVLAIRDIAVDDVGDIYVGAATSTGTFPAAWFVNAFQKTRRGGHDLVIAKIKTDGSRVLWATYLGGTSDEVTTPTVRVDAAHNVYVFTGTTSANIPVPAGFDRILNGPSDGYVAKIASDGTRMIWGTFLGGSGKELNETHSMALDPTTGDVIVAAGTTSTDFPVTAGALQTRLGGLGDSKSTGLGTNYPGDGFVTRIAADGSRIVSSTFIGGADGDGAEGVWVDRSGAVYVSGTTYSTNFPVTVTPSRTVGVSELFVTKLAANLSKLAYSARLGGSNLDIGRACYVDAAGSVYAVGEVRSADFSMLNALQTLLRGAVDGAIFKFIPA
jgi:hypothetical protein